jgi:hypothetical protein
MENIKPTTTKEARDFLFKVSLECEEIICLDKYFNIEIGINTFQAYFKSIKYITLTENKTLCITLKNGCSFVLRRNS